jgi:hypothetical protein
MQQAEVGTVRELIYYQYAGLVARSTFRSEELAAARRDRYGYVRQIYEDLRSGRWRWRDLVRSDRGAPAPADRCAFCGARDDVEAVDLVRRSLTITDKCPRCEVIQGSANRVGCCPHCRAAWDGTGLYGFVFNLFPDELEFWTFAPPGAERRYLQIAYACHKCAGTLDTGDLDGDGRLTALDIDAIFRPAES